MINSQICGKEAGWMSPYVGIVILLAIASGFVGADHS